MKKLLLHIILVYLLNFFISSKLLSEEEVDLRPKFTQARGLIDDPFLDGDYKEMIKKGYEVKYQKKLAKGNTYVLDGVISLFTKSGKLVSLAHYREGFSDGLEVQWNENGQIVRQTTFKEGKKIGNVLNWSDHGVLLSSEEYKNGTKDGKHFYWKNDGKIMRIAHWNNGNLEKLVLYGDQDKPTKILLGMDAKKYVVENFSLDH